MRLIEGRSRDDWPATPLPGCRAAQNGHAAHQVGVPTPDPAATGRVSKMVDVQARYRVPERPPSYVPRARRPDLPANATDKAPAEQCANIQAEGVLAEAGGDRLDSGSGATARGAVVLLLERSWRLL
jgi:hypothetical protein